MKAVCLASSSSGNCFIIEFQDSRQSKIMIEAGLPIKKIMEGLLKNNYSLSKIDCCLVTHSHKDHSAAIADLLKRKLPVYCSKETHIVDKEMYLAHSVDKCIASNIYVTPFSVEHDAEGSLGFIIYNKEIDERILFINDCKYTKSDLSQFDFDYVFIECNYIDRQVRAQLSEAIKANDCGMINRHKRLIDAHMSLYGTLKTLRGLKLTKCKGIFLMHLSDGNANEYIMKQAVFNQTKIRTYICGKYGGIK